MSSSPLRPATDADAEAVAGLFMRAYGNWRPTDAEEIRSWLANSEIPAENIRVLELEGEVVGYGDIWVEDDVQLDMAAPGHWDVFLDWGEARARDAGIGRVRTYFPEGHELEQVVGARGYEYWRSAFVMRIELDERPEVPAFPDGIVVRAYRGEDKEQLRALLNASFSQDPFWHTVSPNNFNEFFLKQRGYDPSLWHLAWDGDDLAGFALTWPSHGSDDTTGWIGTLGVGEPWRKRGLGGALLRLGFGVLYDRGLRRVELGVDAKNVTGALRLYENAGMHRVLRQDNWVKAV